MKETPTSPLHRVVGADPGRLRVTITTMTQPSLQHVYFFIDAVIDCESNTKTLTSAANSPNARTTPSTRSSSLDLSSTSGSSASGVPLSPTAAPFFPKSAQYAVCGKGTLPSCDVPLLGQTQNSGCAGSCKVVDVPGKGLGLVATTFIPRGTRVVGEKPLLRISRNELRLVWEQYVRLPEADKEAYDKLFFYHHNVDDLKMASRLHLIDTTDESLDDDDVDELENDQVRVMGIFNVNNFLISNGALAVFKDISRLNHSCIPNVYHSYNPTLRIETVHAVRDIQAGEELCTNYLGDRNVSCTRQQRWQMLREHYGFTCQCLACTDRTPLSDTKHELFRAIIWGIGQYQSNSVDQTDPMIPQTAADAFRMAEDALQLLLGQELFGVELLRAYHLASELALDLKDFDTALEYAHYAHVVEYNIMGPEMDAHAQSGSAAALWVKDVRSIITRENHRTGRGLQNLMHPKKYPKGKAQKKKKKKKKDKAQDDKEVSGKGATPFD